MADEISNVRVDVGELAKPIDTFIKKISSAAGVIYAPTHTRRMARAKREAALIKAQSEVEIADLKHRAVTRMRLEEMRNQENMENITADAIPLLKEGADPSKLDDDWIVNFYSKARAVSNEKMQHILTEILAGETNAPGTISKRTVNIVGDLDSDDVKLFKLVCSYGFLNGVIPLIFDVKDEIFTKNGVHYDALMHLESLGLLKLDTVGGFHFTFPNSVVPLAYHKHLIIYEIPGGRLDVGKILFTSAGRELAVITKTDEVEGYFEYAKSKIGHKVIKEAMINPDGTGIVES